MSSKGSIHFLGHLYILHIKCLWNPYNTLHCDFTSGNIYDYVLTSVEVQVIERVKVNLIVICVYKMKVIDEINVI